MCSRVYAYPEICFAVVASHVDDLAMGPVVPFILEDPVPKGDLAYEYLAREACGTPGPYFSDWPTYPSSTCSAYPGVPVSPFPREGRSISPASSSSPPPREPPSPEHGKQSRSKPACRQGTPSFNSIQRKWSCSVCKDAFHDKYECQRHIGNVGKQAICLACGKTIGLRKDNRRRHFTKYCKRMDLGRDGGLSFEDAFIEISVYV